jgi:RNA polymerase sigma-70 factor (ECF subfamily)
LTEDGYDSFYRDRYSKTVVLLIGSGASRSDAEDAVQEAMIQAWEQWGTLHNPTAWVRTVAIRKYWRLAAARRPTERLGESVPDWSGDSGLAIFEDEDQQRVLARLGALPLEQRIVLALLIDGATRKEIAELTGKPEATIRSLLRHARKTLKELMKSGES